MPAPTTNLVARYLASAGVTSAGSPAKVSQWDDQSGNANHAAQGTGANQPYLVADYLGRPALRFNLGNTTYLTIGNGFTLAPRACSIWVIGRVLSPQLNQSLVGLVSYGGSAGHLRITSGTTEAPRYRAANQSAATTVRPRMNEGLVGIICSTTASEIHANDASNTGLGAITVDATPRVVEIGRFLTSYATAEIYEVLIYNSGTMSAPDIAALKSYAADTYGLAASYLKGIVFEGDSISTTFGMGATDLSYPSQVLRATTDGWRQINQATSGATVTTLTNRATATDALIDGGYAQNVLLVLIGRNDLPSQSAETFYNALVTYVQARVAAGWAVWVGTLIPEVALTAKITESNQRIKGTNGYTGIVADAGAAKVIDFASLTISTSDGTHPDEAGAGVMSDLVATELAPITYTLRVRAYNGGATGASASTTFEE